ncbi:olfactory receptor 10A4-like [Alligator mississippiensis]|uniref:olfactory receptor 10A4-like n=1 Tax=Alligator mississippiensis TaxID=8496 RepID=UPI0003D0C3DA|nr:olfactory receptor 10A4-like [Alligator mississippiensis]
MTGNHTSVSYFVFLGFADYPELNSVLSVAFLLAYLITLAGNLLIIIITLADSALHTPMYFFLRNLSFLEICYTSVTIPKMLTSLFLDNKTISFIGCATQMYFLLFLGGTECYLLAMMAYDRYVAICHPLHYPVLMSSRVSMELAAASWITNFLVLMGHIAAIFTLPFCSSHEINHFFCDVPPVMELACGDTHGTEIAILLVALFFVLVPFVLILVSYAHIISTILKMPSAEGRYKAFSTCSSHLLAVIIFYGTACAAYLKPKSSHSANGDKIIALFYSVVTPMLNPIIYSLRNKDVKEALRRLSKKMCF